MCKASINRRKLLLAAGAGAVAIGPIIGRAATQAPTKALRVGFVAPITGPLAFFSEHVPFVLDQVGKATGGKITVAGTDYRLKILLRDSQSSPNRAAEVAADLILKDQINLMVSRCGSRNGQSHG
jgi:branched-chain amino acid transport system substrate-binding protein